MGHYIAVDLGAESGRVIVGSLDDSQLKLSEVFRFPNKPVTLQNNLLWDVLNLWSEIKAGISKASNEFDQQIDSIGVDTWGLDFCLLDKNGDLLSYPFHYRDNRTDGMLEEAFRHISREDIFENTGTQILQINTLYQLLSLVIKKSPLLDIAHSFVTIPDLINYWLSGQITNEFSNATTTQCLNAHKKAWSRKLLDAFGIPFNIFQPITEPGTVIGKIHTNLAKEIYVKPIPVVTPACHDTSSAAVAVPSTTNNYAWISSGTWSILGAEVQQPYINEKVLKFNFNNEGGVFGAWQLSKIIMGLWLVQECRRNWNDQGNNFSYEDITLVAAGAEPFLAVIDPDSLDFLHPKDMPIKIQNFCAASGQQIPQTKGQIMRVVLESMALKYRWALERLEEILGNQLSPIHIFGGGSKNHLLNQFTADATGKAVIAGPVEATAIGNIIMQALTLKELNSVSEARNAIKLSFDLEQFEPGDKSQWDEIYLNSLPLFEE